MKKLRVLGAFKWASIIYSEISSATVRFAVPEGVIIVGFWNIEFALTFG